MAQAQSSVANAVIEAVVQRAKGCRQAYGTQADLARVAHAQAQEMNELAATSRANWEACIDWLDSNVPDWELVLGDEDVRSIPNGL